jgi:hypothetical protein
MNLNPTFLQTQLRRCFDLHLISKRSWNPSQTQIRPQAVHTIPESISQVGVTPDIVPVRLASAEALPHTVAVRSARAVIVHRG